MREGEAMGRTPQAAEHPTARYCQGMERLVLAVQALSVARDLPTIMAIVRRTARVLTGADGATFI